MTARQKCIRSGTESLRPIALTINLTNGRLIAPFMKTLDPLVYKVRKESFLERARQLFAMKGYAETSMEDVARACNVQKASLYHYFASKHQLLQELVDLETSRWSKNIRSYEAGKTLEETLMLIGTTFLKDFEQPARREFFKIVYFESHKNPAILRAFKESPTNNRDGFFAVFKKHLASKLDQKQIAMFMVQFMGALIHFATISRLRPENLCPEVFDDASFVRQLVETFSRSLA